MYKRALDEVERASYNGRKQARNFSSTSSVEKKVAALAKSCVKLSENSLQDLKKFMTEHYLPWPEKSPLGPTRDCSRPLWKLEHSLVVPSQRQIVSVSHGEH
ncbi:hypothetical protein MRX96_005879 [Rhipicephalus microplus]